MVIPKMVTTFHNFDIFDKSVSPHACRVLSVNILLFPNLGSLLHTLHALLSDESRLWCILRHRRNQQHLSPRPYAAPDVRILQAIMVISNEQYSLQHHVPFAPYSGVHHAVVHSVR